MDDPIQETHNRSSHNPNPYNGTYGLQEDLYWHNPPETKQYFYYPPTNPDDPKAEESFNKICQLLEKAGFSPRAAYLEWLKNTTLKRAYDELRLVNTTTQKELRNLTEQQNKLVERKINLYKERTRLLQNGLTAQNGNSAPSEKPIDQPPPEQVTLISKETSKQPRPSIEIPESESPTGEPRIAQRERWREQELQKTNDEIHKAKEELEKAIQQREQLLKEEIQHLTEGLKLKEELLIKLETEREASEKSLAKAISESPLLPTFSEKHTINLRALEEALWKWAPSQEALAGRHRIEPAETPMRPFEERAPIWIRGWRTLKGWLTNPLSRLATNLLGPVAAGTVLGINLGVLTGLLTLSEFRRGDKLWLIGLGIAIGIVTEALLGEGWARTTAALRRRGEPIENDTNAKHQDKRITTWFFCCFLLLLLGITAGTFVVDAEGIRLLYQEERIYRTITGKNETLPHWLFYIIGAVVSLPYLSFRAIQGWTDPENRLRAAVLAYQEYEAIQEIRKHPKVQEAIRETLLINSITEKTQSLNSEIQTRKEKIDALRKEFTPLRTMSAGPSPLMHPGETDRKSRAWGFLPKRIHDPDPFAPLKAKIEHLEKKRSSLQAMEINPEGNAQDNPNVPPHPTTEPPKGGLLSRIFSKIISPRPTAPTLTQNIPSPELVEINQQVAHVDKELQRLEEERQRHIKRKDSARDTAIGTSQKFWGRVTEAVEILEEYYKPRVRRPVDPEAPKPKLSWWQKMWQKIRQWFHHLFRR